MSYRSGTQRTGANDTLNNFLDQAYQTGAKIDRDYGIPARKKVLVVGSVYPFTTSLVLVFGALAIIPILTFIGFSLFIFFTFVTTAFIAALTFSGTFILGAGALLLGVLSLAFGFSLFIAVSGFAGFIFFRLLFHLQARDGQGVGAWMTETMMRFGLVDIDEVRTALSAPEPSGSSSPPRQTFSNPHESGVYGSGVANGKAE